MELALDLGRGAPVRKPVRSTMPAMATNEATDGELIVRAGDGDRGAFEVLYRRYARPVFGLALRRLGDRGRAEDAVQETFAAIWRSAASYKPERGPGAPWLYAVARNAIVDRARARGEATFADPPEAVAPARSCPSTSVRCSSSPTGAACRRARSPGFSTSHSAQSRHGPAAVSDTS